MNYLKSWIYKKYSTIKFDITLVNLNSTGLANPIINKSCLLYYNIQIYYENALSMITYLIL